MRIRSSSSFGYVYRHSPVADACGLAGGTKLRTSGAEAGDYTKTMFHQHGDIGTQTLKPLPGYTPPTYKAGGVAEVGNDSTYDAAALLS